MFILAYSTYFLDFSRRKSEIISTNCKGSSYGLISFLVTEFFADFYNIRCDAIRCIKGSTSFDTPQDDILRKNASSRSLNILSRDIVLSSSLL